MTSSIRSYVEIVIGASRLPIQLSQMQVETRTRPIAIDVVLIGYGRVGGIIGPELTVKDKRQRNTSLTPSTEFYKRENLLIAGARGINRSPATSTATYRSIWRRTDVILRGCLYFRARIVD